MSSNNKNNNTNLNLKNVLKPYLSKWKWIALGVAIALALAIAKLRYATYQYQIQASIKLKTENDSEQLQRLQAVQDYGLFNQNTTDVLDEIESLRSRNLLAEVVKELDLSTQFFIPGKIGTTELYEHKPLDLNFYASDSIIKKVDTSFTIEIQSPTEFKFINDDEENQYIYEFGTKINTSFGGMVISPNPQTDKVKPNSKITVALTPLEKTVANLQKGIQISPSHLNSSVLKLQYRDAVKAKGKDILNTLIAKYNESVIQDKIENTKNTADFITERLNNISVELSEFDMTAETVRKTNRLTDLQAQSSLYLESERQTEAALVETETQIQLAEYMGKYLDDNDDLGKSIPTNIGIQDNTFNQTSTRINELVAQRNKILKNSTEKNPTVVNLGEQIKQLRNSIKASVSSMRSSYEIRRNSLIEEDRKLSGRIYSAPKKERQSRDITRQQNIKESLYLYLLEKREESALSQGITTPNAKIVDSAFSSLEPVSPRKSITVLAALIMGSMIPILLIYLLDILNTKVRDKEDVYKVLDVPYLGDIPRSSRKHSLVKEIDYSPKAEAFRLVRTNIDFMLAGLPSDRAKVVFVTSTTSKEGKSHTAINLASSLSYSNKKVLIIETDIRMPKANAYLKMKMKDFGLTDFIGNPKLNIGDVITSHESNPNLHLISSGTVPPNPAELLMSDRMKVLFEKVSSMYDYVIVDTAAVGLVTDTLLISKYADLFVYVVRAGYLDKSQLHTAQDLYEQKRLPNMAILINDVKSKKGYGYGYGNNPNHKKVWWKLAKS